MHKRWIMESWAWGAVSSRKHPVDRVGSEHNVDLRARRHVTSRLTFHGWGQGHGGTAKIMSSWKI